MSAVLTWDVSSVPGCRVKTEGSHRTTYVMSALSNIYEICAVTVCKKFEQRTTPELGRASMHSMGIGIKGPVHVASPRNTSEPPLVTWPAVLLHALRDPASAEPPLLYMNP
jgi:hypothetical protein